MITESSFRNIMKICCRNQWSLQQFSCISYSAWSSEDKKICNIFFKAYFEYVSFQTINFIFILFILFFYLYDEDKQASLTDLAFIVSINTCIFWVCSDNK